MNLKNGGNKMGLPSNDKQLCNKDIHRALLKQNGEYIFSPFVSLIIKVIFLNGKNE